MITAVELDPAFQKQAEALAHSVIAMGNVGRLAEHLSGAFQRLLLAMVERGRASGSPVGEVLNAVRTATEAIVEVSDRDELFVSFELMRLLDDYDHLGQPITPARQRRAKPLAAFPTEPPVVHTLFVDEAGTGSFTESVQPVLCLVGVLAEDSRIAELDAATRELLDAARVPCETEIHAQPLLSGQPPFDGMSAEAREQLLGAFLELGLRRCVGVHYMSMLKPLVQPEFRAALVARGLDAYTSNVLYFNVTLRAAALSRIGVAKYRYLFDRTDRYGADICRLLGALRAEPNPGLQTFALAGEPSAVDSRDHRFIQLADTIGYYLARYRQFEVKTYEPRDALRKHELKYRAAHDLIRPKFLDYVGDDLYRLVDWTALEAWSLDHGNGSNRKASGHSDVAATARPSRNAPCHCGSGRRFKKCHGRTP